MDKKAYFLLALEEEAYRLRHWVLSAFSMLREEDGAHADNPYSCRIIPPGQNGGDITDYYFIDPRRDGAWTLLEGTKPDQPPFSFTEPVSLKKGDIPNLDRDVESTYGNLLFNYLVLVYAFHDKIPYQEGKIHPKAMEALIEPRFTDEPEGGAPLPGSPEWVGGPNAPIYVSEQLRFANAMFSLAGYTQLCVPGATEKSITTHPDMAKLKAKLLEENKDRLHDPAVIARIDAELVALDREWLKGDPAEGVLIKGDSFDVKRKKLYLMHGAEAGFKGGTDVDVITNSLSEGWDISKMPAMVNSLREGSYNRGFLTALGGESVKFYMRVFQNTKVAEEDCGTRLGRPRQITRENYEDFIGYYKAPVGQAKSERLDEDSLKKYIGQTIQVRSPMYCRTEGTAFCARCMGDANSENPKGLGAAASDIGSTFMSLFMSNAHAKALSLAHYNFKDRIS